MYIHTYIHKSGNNPEEISVRLSDDALPRNFFRNFAKNGL